MQTGQSRSRTYANKRDNIPENLRLESKSSFDTPAPSVVENPDADVAAGERRVRQLQTVFHPLEFGEFSE